MRTPETVTAVFDRIHTLTSHMRSVRCCGSCAMNLVGVACGRLDAFYEIGFGGCWDVAAGAPFYTLKLLLTSATFRLQVLKSQTTVSTVLNRAYSPGLRAQ
eukprot:GHUV01053840.1.p1 GENE.GHUV01053840.1~~GHUV01053840.1.p1  ORF type:complete len:114 (+),score=0.57 GHUV01053840.1:41-343(+)